MRTAPDYTTLDTAILKAVHTADRKMTSMGISANSAVKVELNRMATEQSRPAFRILDGRLQALRKAKKLTFGSKVGWK